MKDPEKDENNKVIGPNRIPLRPGREKKNNYLSYKILYK